jgi:hypothetical protein
MWSLPGHARTYCVRPGRPAAPDLAGVQPPVDALGGIGDHVDRGAQPKPARQRTASAGPRGRICPTARIIVARSTLRATAMASYDAQPQVGQDDHNRSMKLSHGASAGAAARAVAAVQLEGAAGSPASRASGTKPGQP